jgi:hypothetical protein
MEVELHEFGAVTFGDGVTASLDRIRIFPVIAAIVRTMGTTVGTQPIWNPANGITLHSTSTVGWELPLDWQWSRSPRIPRVFSDCPIRAIAILIFE